MKKSSTLSRLLATLGAAARGRGFSDTAWAERAGVRKETLSRLRNRDTCDLATLDALGEAVGMTLLAATSASPDTTADGHLPLGIDRHYEQQLLELCVSRTFDDARWCALGPRYFMAGLAVMLASSPQFDRRGLLALAERLHPGVSEPAVFSGWLARSPLRPSRFLPLLEAERPRAA